jgi:hypothetical protein
MEKYTMELKANTIQEIEEIKKASDMKDDELMQDILSAYRESIEDFNTEQEKVENPNYGKEEPQATPTSESPDDEDDPALN